jgi:hypothetical protein
MAVVDDLVGVATYETGPAGVHLLPQRVRIRIFLGFVGANRDVWPRLCKPGGLKPNGEPRK